MASEENHLKVAVLGPSGQCGRCVVDELLSRGHHVVDLSRNPPQTWTDASKYGESYRAESVDIQDIPKLSSAFSGGFDSIVCAFSPPLSDMNNLYESDSWRQQRGGNDGGDSITGEFLPQWGFVALLGSLLELERVISSRVAMGVIFPPS